MCTSPSQLPELVPGLDTTGSFFSFTEMYGGLFEKGGFVELPKSVEVVLICLFLVPFGAIVYLPAWLYRVSIKSTLWFWWPLAFLGQDLQLARNPDLLQWRIAGALWAKTSLIIAFGSLLMFVLANLVAHGAFFERNPLITPVGYLLLFDWRLWPWQVCAMTASALSVLLVYWVDDVGGRYRIAKSTNDTELLRSASVQFGWIERVSRLRLLVVVLFWLLAGLQAALYLNNRYCLSSLPDSIERWAQSTYGPLYSKSDCSGTTR